VGRKCNLKVTFPRVQGGVREWAHTLPNGLPFGELDFLWTPKFSKSNLKGQNSLYRKVHYAIGNLLGCRCSKWAPMIHLSTYNANYGWKKGQESKCQFDSWPLKVMNCPELCACRWCATYFWKDTDKGYIFYINLASIKGVHKKLWASKVARVPISGILKFMTWESWGKWHFGVAPVASHKEYYKGEGGGFP
jgi:hypothetical protein